MKTEFADDFDDVEVRFPLALPDIAFMALSILLLCRPEFPGTLTLPTVDNHANGHRVETAQPIRIELRDDGHLRMDGQEIDRDTLVARLRADTDARPIAVYVDSTDSGSGPVVSLFQLLKRLGSEELAERVQLKYRTGTPSPAAS